MHGAGVAHTAEHAEVVGAATGKLGIKLRNLQPALAVLFELERRTPQVRQTRASDLGNVLGDAVGNILAIETIEFWFGVEGVDVARPTPHEQADHLLGGAAIVGAAKVSVDWQARLAG